MIREPKQLDLFDWRPQKETFRLGKIELNTDSLVAAITIFFGLLNLPFLFLWQVFGLGVALVALFLVLVITALIWLPKYQINTLKSKKGNSSQSDFDIERDYLKLLDDTRKTLAQIIGGIFFAIGLVITYYTFELTKERQLAERYSEAIKLLEPKNNLSTRTGVIYDLENISKDSDKLHLAIIDFLILYIGEQSIKTREQIRNHLIKIKQESGEQLVEIKPEDDCYFIDGQNNKDIIIAGRIIKNRNIRIGSDFALDFNNGLLNQSDFKEGQLSKANFENACLNNVNFNSAVLTGSTFKNTNVANAKFNGANLRSTDLKGMINLTAEQISVANIDKDTLVHDHLEPAKEARLKAISDIERRNRRNLFPFNP